MHIFMDFLPHFEMLWLTETLFSGKSTNRIIAFCSISVTHAMPSGEEGPQGRRPSGEKQYNFGSHPADFSPFKGWIPSSFCHFYLFVV